MKIPKSNLLSLSALAIELRCDRRTLRSALRDVPADGILNRHPTWRKATAVGALAAARTSELSATKTRLISLKADIAELELNRLRADTVPADQVRNLLSRCGATVRSAFAPVAGRVAARIRDGMATGEKEVVIREEIDAVMTNLSNLKKA